jgi:hypothetical protein
MRHVLVAAGVAIAIASTAGCSLAMRPVPVSASHIQWEALAGEWHGTYEMNGYDRHGTIAFKLVAIEEQASGEVLMIPERTGWPYTMNRPEAGQRPEPVEPRTQLLTIRFVEASDGTLSGTMDPYWDPDRRCTARASFTGVVEGDSVNGTVTSVCENDVGVLRGQWRARRNRTPGAGR